jgi:hypothetical protein
MRFPFFRSPVVLLCAVCAWLSACSTVVEKRGRRAQPAPDVCTTEARWEAEVAPVVHERCATCHSRFSLGSERHGAPRELDFDTLADVVVHQDAFVAALSLGSMPPDGALTDDERSMLLEWADCGSQGDELVVSCADLVVFPGDLFAYTEGDTEGFCSRYNAVEGDLGVMGPASLDCLCDVGGDLLVAGAGQSEVELPQLQRVGAGVQLDDVRTLTRLSLPALTLVETGSVMILSNERLESLELPELASVGGTLRLRDNPALRTLVLPALREVGDKLVVVDHAALVEFELPALETIGGEVLFEDNDAILDVDGLGALSWVGDSFTIRGNASLRTLEGFVSLTEVVGDFFVRNNTGLLTIDGFDALEIVGGSVRIRDNASLSSLRGLERLQEVASLSVTGNPKMQLLDGLDLLRVVEGHLGVTDNAGLLELAAFDLLEEVGGDLDLSGNARITVIGGFSRLESAGARLDLSHNPMLVSVYGLGRLQELGGSLLLVNLPQLHDVQGLAAIGAVGGHVELRGTALAEPLGLNALIDIGADLVVRDNPLLVSLHPWTELQTVGRDLKIVGNRRLPTSMARRLERDLDSIGGDVRIHGNGPG